METETANTTNWRSNILIILFVLSAILLALILAQLDSLNELIQPLPTAIAELPVAGSTPLAQPTSLPTLTPIPTNTGTSTSTPTPAITATPASIIPACGNIPSGWLPYLVKPGDTLYALSIRSGASMEAISYANCLEMGNLIAGTTIYLPPTPPVLPPCGVPAYWILYTVQAGDTLYSLSTRTGTTVYTVMRANCLTSTYIYAGQPLYLPSHPAPIATATPSAIPPTILPTVIGTITSTPLTTATATGTISPTAYPTITTTAYPTTTAFPTTTPISTLPPPSPTSIPTAYPPGPIPSVPPPPTTYP